MFSKVRKFIDSIARLFLFDRRIDEVKINQGRILSQMQRPTTSGHLWQHEFKVFSQWGEDGIIQYLVNNLNIINLTFIEFGVEDFFESNCRFLLMKNRWSGFVIDGSEKNINRIRSSYFYWQYPLRCRASFITRENVESILEESCFGKELGLLSVDIDGVDYFVLEALENWRPAILIVEYNEVFGYERSVSVPYDPKFVRMRKHKSNLYYGASLPAFCFLANKRNYALVGTNSVGSNAFFVRRELLNDCVKETSINSCALQASFRESRGVNGQLTFLDGAERAKAIADMKLVDVTSGSELLVRDLVI
jgi:hypothetical protein